MLLPNFSIFFFLSSIFFVTLHALCENNDMIQVSQVKNCLEGNTMSNRGAYSTKERMPSEENRDNISSLEGCT